MSIPTIIDTLCEISGQLHGIHSTIKRQTELLVRMTEKPKEAAPAPKAITWQEAVEVLRAFCQEHRYCADCPAYYWCDKALPMDAPVVPPYKWEVPVDE